MCVFTTEPQRAQRGTEDYGLPCNLRSAACLSCMFVPPRATARTSESGRVGRMRIANAGGVLGLWMRPTRTSRLDIHWVALVITSAIWKLRKDDLARRATSSTV